MPEPPAAGPGDRAGAETLDIMTAAPRYNAWQYEVIAPFVGRRILEVGAGIGNLSQHLLSEPRELAILTDTDPWYREELARRFGAAPGGGVRIEELTLPDPGAGARFGRDRLDTAVALNVVEHIEDDVSALATLRSVVRRDGRVVILVPAMDELYGSLDIELGHFRRYSRRRLRDVIERAGLRVIHLEWFNRVGTLGWWLNARVRMARRIPVDQLRQFDRLVPLLKLERWMRLPFGQSLIGVGVPA
jgi:SAM-dependent methyltransferase